MSFAARKFCGAFVATCVLVGCDSGDSPDPVGDNNQNLGSIQGVVRDAANLDAIAGAVATTTPVSKEVVSAADGTFTVDGLVPGQYELHVTANGYQTLSLQSVIVQQDSTTSVDIDMVAVVVYASSYEACHLQRDNLLASLAEDPPPEAPNEGGSAGEG